jgi:outer membrane protein assembly factor BamB
MTFSRNAARLLRLALGLAGLLLLAGADWPQFLGPTRNGVSTETGLLQSWPAKGPPLLWERPVGEGFSGPVVAGDRLVLFHRVGGDEVVECLDPATGKPRWKFDYACAYRDPFRKGNGPRSTPVITGDHVITLGASGVLTCLGLADGKKVWQRNLAGDYELRPSFFGVGSSPIVEGKLLVLNVGARDAGIVAFDRDTGKEVWRATDHDASYASPVAATIAGERHLLFFTREGLVSLDPANGKVRFFKRWRAKINESVNAASPVVVGNEVFLTACYSTGAVLLRVTKDGPEEVWKGDESLSCHYGTPVYHDGSLFGFDGRQEEGGRLRCIGWKTGKVHWTKDGFGCGSLILAGGNLIVLSEDGDLVLVETTPSAYHEKSRASVLTGPCRAQIALAAGRLFARDNKNLKCWNLKKD